MRGITIIVSGLVAGISSVASAQSLLYDVTFSQSQFVPGQIVPTASGSVPRETPSRILTTPVVSNTFGPLPGNVALLSPPANITAEYIAFDIVSQFPAYRVSFDLAISVPGTDAGGGFTLFADVPTIRPFRWLSNGTITGLVASGGTGAQIGSWNLNQAYAIDTIWNLQTQSASLFIDGQHIVTQPFSASQVSAFRLSTGTNPSFPGLPTVAGVDNIRIEGLIPAPSSALCVMVPSMLFAVKRRRA